MPYTCLDDFAQRKAALRAELAIHEKQILSMKKSLLTPVTSSSKRSRKGLFGFVAPKNIFSTTITAIDGAWFVWKIWKRFKKK